jgi:hypothetical protein
MNHPNKQAPRLDHLLLLRQARNQGTQAALKIPSQEDLWLFVKNFFPGTISTH